MRNQYVAPRAMEIRLCQDCSSLLMSTPFGGENEDINHGGSFGDGARKFDEPFVSDFEEEVG